MAVARTDGDFLCLLEGRALLAVGSALWLVVANGAVARWRQCVFWGTLIVAVLFV